MGATCPSCGRTFDDEGGEGQGTCPHCGAAPGSDPSGETMALTPQQMKAAGLGAPPAPPPDGSYRHVIKGYELLKKLGEGGMGGVFLARQKSTGKHVALKILRGALARDRDYVTRLAREAKLASELDHPNIIRAFETGESSGHHYLAMDYVEGKSLNDVLEIQGVLREKESLEIALQMARALAYAHTMGIVHRDIKPDNIMITREGTAKLADLGLAKQVDSESGLTQTGTTMGTPDYMSPEQARGDKDIDIRSDIYSLGATLFRMVTGKPPFEGPSPGVVIAKRLTEVPPSPSEVNPTVSSRCDRLISRMISPHRDDRHQTPQELVIDIEKILAGDPAARAREEPESTPRRRTTAMPAGADAHLSKARTHYLAGEFQQAQRAYSAALGEKPSCREAWIGQILMLLDMRQYGDAWTWADKAQARFRADPDLLAAKSLVQRRLGQDQYAGQLCDAALGGGGGALAWLSRGEALLAEGSPEADKCLAKALARTRERGTMHIRVAQVYLAHGRNREALSMLKQASAALPGSALAWHLLGTAQDELGMFAEARDSHGRASELAPGNEKYRAAASAPPPSIGRRVAGFFRRKLGK
jgi:serine/threonine protein kinase